MRHIGKARAVIRATTVIRGPASSWPCIKLCLGWDGDLAGQNSILGGRTIESAERWCRPPLLSCRRWWQRFFLWLYSRVVLTTMPLQNRTAIGNRRSAALEEKSSSRSYDTLLDRSVTEMIVVSTPTWYCHHHCRWHQLNGLIPATTRGQRQHHLLHHALSRNEVQTMD